MPINFPKMNYRIFQWKLFRYQRLCHEWPHGARCEEDSVTVSILSIPEIAISKNPLSLFGVNLRSHLPVITSFEKQSRGGRCLS